MTSFFLLFYCYLINKKKKFLLVLLKINAWLIKLHFEKFKDIFYTIEICHYYKLYLINKFANAFASIFASNLKEKHREIKRDRN